MSDSPDPHPICYVEIPAPDLARAHDFYRDIFGWSMQPSGDYLMFESGEGALAGGLDPRKALGDGVVLYIRVTDIPATLERIEQAGGQTIRPRSEVGDDYGYFALFRDPNGNQMGLWSRQ